MSSAQRRLWFAEQLENAGSTYVLPSALRLRGALDVNALRAAIDAVVGRHGMLRARIVEGSATRPAQRVASAGPVDLPVVDLTANEAGDRETEAFCLATAEVRRLIDLSEEPPFRPSLLRIDAEDHLLVLALHHLAADGFSIALLERDLLECYAAALEGRPPVPLAAASMEAAVAEESTPEARAEAAEHAKWFVERLADAPAVLDLPADRPRPGRSTFAGITVLRRLDAGVADRVKALAAAERVTPFVAYSALLHALLARCTGQRETVVGFMVANRTVATREVVGLLANALPQRLTFDDDPTVRELLERARTEFLGAVAHARAPLEEVVDALGVPRSLAHHPVFQVLINYFDSPPTLEGGGLEAEPLMLDSGSAWLDLELSLRRSREGGVALELKCSADLFDEASGARLLDHFATLVDSATADPDLPVSELTLLSDHERAAVLAAGTGPRAPAAAEQTLRDLMLRQLGRTPERCAVSFEGSSLTYGQLGEQAAGLARRLREHGVGRDVVVGVCAPRSLDLMAGLAGIVLAGGAFLPLDPDHPDARIASMIEQAVPALVLATRETAGRLDGAPVPVWVLDDVLAEPPRAGAPDVTDLDPDALAYVLFTSGSTGRPKGVANTQRAIHNRLRWMQDAYRIGPNDVVLQKTPQSFDVSIWELLWPLVTGARLVLARPGGHRDPDYLGELMVVEQITVAHFVPSMLRVFLDAGGVRDGSVLRHLICSGEALSPELRDRALEDCDAELHNLYGPTEAAIDVTAFTCRREPRDRHTVPIGRAVANTRVHVLDGRREPVPFGVVGELYLGGAQLARGYIGQPELTAERFVPDPHGGPHERIYRTGDLGRMRPDGVIEFSGRVDRQIKLRGFRIELGEVEAVIDRVPGVRHCVVKLVEADAGSSGLAAYVVADRERVTPEIVRGRLAEELPEYMVPSAFLFLDEMPLGTAGKVDHARLPALDPVASARFTAPAAEPTTPSEQLLLDCVREVVRQPAVGIDDSFFAIGGDSIRSIELVTAARRQGLHLGVEDVFAHPTVRDLARVARSAPTGADAADYRPFGLVDVDPRDLPVGVVDAYPLSTLLAGLVFQSSLDRGYRVYVTSIRLRGAFNEGWLREAVAAVAARHPFLRSSVMLSGPNAPLQIVRDTVPDPVAVIDMGGVETARQEALVEVFLAEEAERRFDWTTPPLLRLTAHILDDDCFRLTLAEPLLDGWSAALVLTEILGAIEQLKRGAVPPARPEVRVVPEFLRREQAALASTEVRNFWRDELEGAPVIAVPRSAETAGVPQPRSVEVPVPADVSDALLELALTLGVPLKSVLLAVHVRVLAALSGQTEVVTGLMANTRPETEDGAASVGLFLNTNLLRLRLPGGSWIDLIRAVKAGEERLLRYRVYPYAQVLLDQGAAGGLAETTFNYTHFRLYGAGERTGGLAVAGVDANDQTYFPLTAQFQRDAASGRVKLRLELFGTGFQDWDADRIAQLYRNALAEIARSPRARYDAQCLLAPGEDPVERLLYGAPAADAPRFLPQVFEERAAGMLDRCALIVGDRRWSYGEVRDRAWRLAERLREAGVEPGDRVGVCVPRSAELVVGMLGVLAARAVYTPLDPGLPEERRDRLARAARCRTVLVVEETRDLAPGGAPLLGVVTAAEGNGSVVAPRLDGHPESAAFLMFTSGSTGAPKGVLLSHRAVHNRLAWGWRALPLAEGERTCARTPIGFVDSLAELLHGLLGGVPTVVVPPRAEDPAGLVDVLSFHAVTHVTLVPTLLAEILDQGADLAVRLPRLRHWTLSGEPLAAALTARLHHELPHATVHNLYGATEVTADVTAHRVDGREAGPVIPLGRPIDGCHAAVVDGWGRAAPAGAFGELVVGGRGVALGYWDAPGQTAERFVPDPSGGLAYRTGDFVRHGRDGELEYVGRIDRQLKVRGVRLEPTEIEAALCRAAGVHGAVVAKDRERGELVAYLLLDPDAGPPAVHDLRSAVRRSLPSAAVPQSYACVTGWPLTSSGKVDHAALARVAEPLAPRPAGRESTETLVERELAALWTQRLGVADVARHDDFFELGGNSLQAILLIAEVRDLFGVELTVVEVFDHPALLHQAVLIERHLVLTASADELHHARESV